MIKFCTVSDQPVCFHCRISVYSRAPGKSNCQFTTHFTGSILWLIAKTTQEKMQDLFAEDIIVDGEIVIRWPYLWDVNSGSGIGLGSAGKKSITWTNNVEINLGFHVMSLGNNELTEMESVNTTLLVIQWFTSCKACFTLIHNTI